MLRTLVLKVDPDKPENGLIKEAAQIIKKGGLVAFPTETVYGLGANALNDEAVRSIYKAKGRPSDNPLIVHVSSIEQVYHLASEVSLLARRVMEVFWPGPLTVVLPCKDTVSKTVTGGLDTVAIRMPKHKVALTLIGTAQLPIAAPSANTSGKPSPTEAEHVLADLAGRIDAVIDGGSAKVGLESTVLDLTSDPPVILRPGGVSKEELEAVLGHLGVDSAIEGDGSEIPRAPGMKYRHYSPAAPLILIEDGPLSIMADVIKELAADYVKRGKRVALLISDEMYPLIQDIDKVETTTLGSRNQLEDIAGGLFGGLRRLDLAHPDVILAEGYSKQGIGLAIMNRLKKAASKIVEI